MDERITKLLNILRKHADRMMVAVLLLAVGVTLFVRVTEETQVSANPNPSPYKPNPMIPNRDYDVTIAYAGMNAEIDHVQDQKYQDLKIFNPFDKQIIRIGEEIEKRLNQLMKDAREADKTGNYKRCIEICNKILSQDYNRVEAKELRKKSQDALAQQNQPAAEEAAP